jgi:hypothetical protein
LIVRVSVHHRRSGHTVVGGAGANLHVEHLLPHVSCSSFAEVELDLYGGFKGLHIVEDKREGDQTAGDSNGAEHNGDERGGLERLGLGFVHVGSRRKGTVKH